MKTKHIVVGAATVGLIAIAGPAFAAGPPYTVKVGTNASGTYNITAASNGAVNIRALNNGGTQVNLSCTKVTGSGKVFAGTNINPVGQITGTSWTGCTAPGGAVNVTQNGTWNVTGTGTNATSALTDTINGTVTNVSASVANQSSSTTCSFTVTGAPRGNFSETTNSSTPQKLNIAETGFTGNLKIASVTSGCLGQLQANNPINFQATLDITSPSGAINLS